ncbi:hypothetical protein CAXC1_220029 [Candidatus Xenohaliotis californiensis]|uniref:Uncharacterized protein n=1 Tax=Candidatus Xenohaliotis californiensis TaxID=84677 RepID=A0ABM9N7Q0_9RICK|nr:hypothetical protein CAXC1_220029 [Candidatus Xenohaliotis californiensis]
MSRVFLLKGIVQLIEELPKFVADIACDSVHIIVPSKLFANTLCYKIRNIDFSKLVQISTIYDIDHSITGNVAPGKKIISKALRGFLAKKILHDMNLALYGDELLITEDMCLAMDKLYSYGLGIKDICLKSAGVQSLEILVEFINRWDAYLHEHDMIDAHKYHELRVRRIIENGKRMPFIAINLPVADVVLHDFMLNIASGIGAVIFTGVSMKWLSAKLSSDSPFFHHQSFLTAVYK